MNERTERIFELVKDKLDELTKHGAKVIAQGKIKVRQIEAERGIQAPEPSARKKLERAEMPKRTWKGKGPEPEPPTEHPIIRKLRKPVKPGKPGGGKLK